MANNCTRSTSSSALMAFVLRFAPSANSLDSTLGTGTPIASEKLRTVAGMVTTTLLLRGAAVLSPELRFGFGLERRIRPTGSSSPVVEGRNCVGVPSRLRLNCRCSRPPSAAANSASGSAPALAVLRPRSRPAGRSSDGGGAWLGLARGTAALWPLPPCVWLRACRRCSCSGLAPPVRPARMASAGNFRSGFWGAGSSATCAVGCATLGIGATRMAGPDRGRSLSGVRRLDSLDADSDFVPKTGGLPAPVGGM